MSSASPTYFISDRRMLKHRCEWDKHHIERPERLSAILELLENDGILNECEHLESVECSIEDLQLVHTKEYIDKIRSATQLPTLEQMEDFCAQNEDIYINEHSWQSALLSAGCALRVMEKVINMSRFESPSANAFAAIRPPGHHASNETACGFCLFNNVAICAKKAREMGVERVLILDWDIHAGQGTQYCVEGDPGILLVSAHRFEHGQYWPELPESGIVHQYKNTINVPLNELGYGDAEYAALMHFLVLPLIHQWQPGLILVSCGFDAALGDPQGEMEITPAGYGYMTALLAQLGIPLCFLLEGGYFIESVAQGALFCTKALVNRIPPVLNFCNKPPSPVFLNTLYSVLLVHSKQFPLFGKFCNYFNQYREELRTMKNKRKRRDLELIKLPNGEYRGNRQFLIPNPTRGEYPPREPAVERHYLLKLRQLLDSYEKKPAERELLSLDLQSDGAVRIPNGHGNGDGNGGKLLLHIKDRNQFMLIYFYLLLPLAFTYFDVHLANHKLPLGEAKFNEFLSMFSANGNGNGDKQVDLDSLIDTFEQLKPFFLF